MIDKFLNLENAKAYAATQDKLIFCEELTDFPMGSKKLEQFMVLAKNKWRIILLKQEKLAKQRVKN